jgi:hypothetical protein
VESSPDEFLPDEYLHRYPLRDPEAETRLEARAAGGEPFSGVEGLGFEMAVVHAGRGLRYTLNETAAIIWHLADGKTSLAAAVDAICEQFDVERYQASLDAVELVRELEARGFLTLLDEPG